MKKDRYKGQKRTYNLHGPLCLQVSFPMLVVQCQSIKQQLARKATSLADALLEGFMGEIRRQNEAVKERFDSYLQRIKVQYRERVL